ncbi:AraC family transcriptional regulator ligand-binding domain-containing protein [Psychromonas sp. KJ10-2]|uniref:AraC family transcriptional regulator ligand-binding domain-containing protein n=1 Tax=Psychromonas sp. KJ10-2 TaxID=3391822 RepID=UPI0039B3D096
MRLHLIRASHLIAVVQYMHSLSLPVDTLLQKAELDHVPLDDANQLILETKVWRFLELAAEMKAMPHLGGVLAEQSDLAEYGDFTKQLLEADNLYQALHFLIHKIGLHNNNSLFWLKENEQCVWICRPQYPYVKDKQWQAEQHVLGLLCKIIENYAGPGWQPSKIKLQDTLGLGLEHSQFFSNAQIQLGQRYSGIAIEHSLLQERQLSKTFANASSLESIPDCFVQSFKLLLKQNYFGQGWLAENIAYSLGTSVRTLKESCRSRGHHYVKYLMK